MCKSSLSPPPPRPPRNFVTLTSPSGKRGGERRGESRDKKKTAGDSGEAASFLSIAWSVFAKSAFMCETALYSTVVVRNYVQ